MPVMQSKSVTIGELRTNPPKWVTKTGDIAILNAGASAYILPTGGTAGILACTLSRDTVERVIPISITDIMAPLPDIRTINLSTTTADNNTILLCENHDRSLM